ncbi:MAG: LPS assembly protein LptD [Xanthomonadales bacterium]|nr:LPS assembly protein LptD [Gammaproteobacteria bacterium]MBT8076794.1 LPS assembly protein LptD [Gammaproteobacteria bacterium]NNK05629.1 LPS assembly protein LptD [Xanthomonadales bacterium]
MILKNFSTSVLLPVITVTMLSFQGTAHSADTDVPGLACPGPSLAPMIKNVPDRSAFPISVKTRQFDARKEGQAEARENVELRRGDQLLTTELLRYDPQQETITMPGKVDYEDSVIYISGTGAQYSFLEESGSFIDVNYGLMGSSARGSADEVTVESRAHSILHGMQFTTCPGETPEWLLSANELELDFDEGVGTVKGAKLQFFDIPFLYLPWMTFPIDDRRKSGFLYPYISTANDTGFEFSIPYYWNIAPAQDATITPRYFTERGFMLTGEYRFMTPRSAGELDFDYMGNDTRTNDSRYYYRFEHGAALNPRWQTRILVDRVSDNEFFQDFSNSLAAASRQYLRSNAGIYGSGRYWRLAVIADDFQVVDDAVDPLNKPYRRLPRIAFDLDRPLGSGGLRLKMDAELVYFDRDIGATGARFDIFPRLTWNVDTDWGYMRPSAGYRYTKYDLNWHGESGDKSPDRGTEIVSFDTGLFLERDSRNGKLQTLEPRLFYLYVPYKDQQGLPDFDTAPFTFGFSQLFHFNRFTGADLQSDANQLTLALTTRSIDPVAGRELWSLSFGQILYFEDQRVIPEAFDETLSKDSSPFIAEFVLHLTRRLSGRIGTQWNWKSNQFDVAVLGATYSAPSGLRLGAEYRYRRGSLDQFDIRYYQPINERWRVLGRFNYSLLDSDLLAAEAGFEYESCCWALRMVAKRFLRNRDGDHRDAIYLQLILKGLGNIGRRSAPLFYDLAY